MPVLKSLTIDPAYKILMFGDNASAWDLIVADGTVTAKNTILIGSQASGGATFIASDGSIDGGNNTGWTFLSDVSPTLTTEASTSVSVSSLLANAYLAYTPLNATQRGFCYKAGYEETPTTADSVVYEDGDFEAARYSLAISELNSNAAYSIRAYVIVNGTTYYGNVESLYTYPEAPQNLSLEADVNAITATWDDVENVDLYALYWATTSGVTTSSNRILGVSSPFIHDSLIPGVIYYYRVSAISNNLESDLSNEASSLTLASSMLPTFSPNNYLLTANYIKLLTSQYQNAVKFKSWLQHNLDILHDGMTAAHSINDRFDIDFASGAQLDIIGTIVGQKRILPFEPTDGSDPVLDNETYRSLLKAKIAMNHWDGQLYSIEQQWQLIFPETQIIIVDNQDMTINVSVLGTLSSLLQDLIEHDMLIPRPQGVKMNLEWSPETTAYFAYDMENNEYNGYDIGRWHPTYTGE